jgi:predicted 3-demethylubiquinone-9 3-methyltransferase (glyoxalase superfamily)
MQKVIPHLWFDTQAKEAAGFYTTVFPNSKVKSVRVIKDTPSGDCDVVSFDIMGFSFQAISAGPYFKINPSISFMVNFDPSQDTDARKHMDEVWTKLIAGGKIMMPLDKYPFSEHYGWVEDKYGVSWQLIFTNPEGEERPFIIPSLMFTQGGAGKAEEATNFYLSVFKNAKRGTLARYPAGMAPDKEGTVMFTDFQLEKQWFAAMDSAQKHEFIFNEAVSLIVNCETQEEIDYYWNKLSKVPESEQCGWCKDQYGVSWQIIPTSMNKMMAEGTPEQMARVTEAFLKMKKFDIVTLKAVYNNK